jgi:hypothetical protein
MNDFHCNIILYFVLYVGLHGSPLACSCIAITLRQIPMFNLSLLCNGVNMEVHDRSLDYIHPSELLSDPTEATEALCEAPLNPCSLVRSVR